jgi:hypothetical protein
LLRRLSCRIAFCFVHHFTAMARAALILRQARFESGNLKSAIRVGEHEYDCTLRNDMFTDGHTQWFFFSV